MTTTTTTTTSRWERLFNDDDGQLSMTVQQPVRLAANDWNEQQRGDDGWQSVERKQVYVRTKTKGVRLLSREVYLRHDVGCQHSLCRRAGCPSAGGGKLAAAGQHLVIPSAGVVEIYLELIEECLAKSFSHRESDAPAGEFAFGQLVFLQHVVAEVVQSRGFKLTPELARQISTAKIDADDGERYFDGLHIDADDGERYFDGLHIDDDDDDDADATETRLGIGVWGQQAERRIGSLLADGRRAAVLFRNENFAATFSSRQRRAAKAESVREHSARLVEQAARWLAAHLRDVVSAVVVVDLQQANSNDDEQTSGDAAPVLHMKVSEYLAWAEQTPPELRLLHRSIQDAVVAQLRQQVVDGEQPSHGLKYTEHLTGEVLDAGVKSGRWRSGKLAVNAKMPYEGYVRVDGDSGGDDIFIADKESMNRAIDGDTVAVELLDEQHWAAPSDRALHYYNADGSMKKIVDRSTTTTGGAGRRPTGRVVGVVAANRRSYVATLQTEKSGPSAALAVPVDVRIPKVRIATRQGEALADQRLVVRIDRWPLQSRYPEGHVVRALGRIGDLATEVDAILTERDVAVEPFTSLLTASLPRVAMPAADSDDEKKKKKKKKKNDEQAALPVWRPSAEEIASRRDLRDTHVIFSIDPPGCTDIDDALSARRLDDGSVIEVGVHIADVSAFVAHDSLLDMEARHRGTTVYLAHRRFDMLPEVLSANLCSLLGNAERYAMSVLWRYRQSDDGELTLLGEPWFGRTVIRSAAALQYQQAQDLLDGKTGGLAAKVAGDWRRLVEPLQLLAAVGRRLRRRRLAQGALELAAATEIRFDFEAAVSESAAAVGGMLDPKSLTFKAELEVNGLVAEFMILANAAVAERIHRYFPTAALLRRHPPPFAANLAELRELMALRGVVLHADSNAAMAASLDACSARRADGDDEAADREQLLLIRMTAARAMNEAKYISSGEHPVADYAHFGLALPFYTHFTSPIRRYADLIVHRLLWLSIVADRQRPSADCGPVLADSALRTVCAHINQKNRSAKLAAQDSHHLFLMRYIAQRPDDLYDGLVSSVKSNGFLVQVPWLGLRGPVYLLDEAGLPAGLPPPFTAVDIDAERQEIRLTDASGGAARLLRRLHRVAVRIQVTESRYRRSEPVFHLHSLSNESTVGHGAVTAISRSAIEHSVCSQPLSTSSTSSTSSSTSSSSTSSTSLSTSSSTLSLYRHLSSLHHQLDRSPRREPAVDQFRKPPPSRRQFGRQ